VQNTNKKPSEITIAHSTFLRGVGYFTGIEQGMVAAGKHYGCKILLGGPTSVDMAAQQAEMETWINQGVDAIAFIAGDPASLTPTINKGVAKGIVMLSYDSDAILSNRQVYNNQANDIEQAEAQLDELARQMNGSGKWAFLVGNFTQELKMFQFEYMKKYAAKKYPKMQFTEILECKGDQALINQQTRDLLTKYPDLRGIVSNDGSGPTSIAQTLKDLGKTGKVAVTGLTTPSVAYNLVKSGALPAFYIWDVYALGYRNVAIAWELLHGHDITRATKLPLSDKTEANADIRKNLTDVQKLDIVLGKPLRIDASNIDQYNYF
jgi:ABC-type sugar transport system substrate-binding protein